MIVVLNIILFLLVLCICYLTIWLGYNFKLGERVSKFVRIKNEKYYENLITYYNKSKKIKMTSRVNVIYRIGILLEKAGIKSNLLINPYMLLLLCLLCFFIGYSIAFSLFKMVFLSIIVSIPALFIPIAIINLVAEYMQNKLEKIMLDFILQLKNYTQINNDIIYAFKQVKTLEPMQGYINSFLIEVNSGIKFEKAIENIKEKVGFERLKQVFANIEYCYIYGGDFALLMDKSYKMISKVQKEKSKRMQDTKSARIVMGILIVLDLFIYFSYIKNNPSNLQLMTKRFMGNLILYWNFISIWLLIWLMRRVKKLEY
ncbi:MAG: hypothetical protein IKR04_01245 [Clostridia bacterium]|nr:hypothetical protein [Clostridia bacterium]